MLIQEERDAGGSTSTRVHGRVRQDLSPHPSLLLATQTPPLPQVCQKDGDDGTARQGCFEVYV